MARRVARSVCAEMHSGFQALRGAMPMNIRSKHPGKGMTPESRKDIDRIVALWTDCRERFGGAGSLLFGALHHRRRVLRAGGYALPDLRGQAATRRARSIARRCWRFPRCASGCDAARRETEFVAADEPYATK